MPRCFKGCEPQWDEELGVLSISDLFGIQASSELAYRVKQRTRWKKSLALLASSVTWAHLVIFVVIIRPVLDAMTVVFEGESDLSAVHFACAGTNPAAKAIVRYFDILSDQHSLFWSPVKSITGWGSKALSLCWKLVLKIVGGLFLRCVAPFCHYPWKLALAVHPWMQEDRVEHVIREFQACSCSMCMDSGFSRKYADC